MTTSHETHMMQYHYAAFLVDRRARRLADNTIEYYKQEVGLFVSWAVEQGVTLTKDITPSLLRMYLLHLADRRSPGGCHAAYRALRVWLLWCESEYDFPAGWHNPVRKLAPPKVSREPIQGITLDDVKRLLAGCDRSFLGQRDKVIILVLLDTGLRMAELLALNVEDVDLSDGSVLVHHGKGDKPRQVYVSPSTRRDMQRYLRLRGDASEPALFVTRSGTRLSRGGLRQMMDNREMSLGITTTGLHAFRRAFAVEMLRSGADVLTISRLLGHSGINLVQRYARQTDEDLRKVHERTSPVDRLKH